MGILAVFALCLIAFGPVATGKSVSAFALSLSKDAITLCGLFYGAAQLSKGMAQMGKPTTPESSALSVPGAPTPTQAIVAPTPIATEPTTSAKA